MRVGLVLGAGGYAGHAFHAGVLGALQGHTGWDPHDASHIVGTSAGSVVGAMLRGGLDLDRIAKGMPSGRRARAAAQDGVTAPGAHERVRRPMRPGLVVRGLLPPWSLRPGVALSGLLPQGRVPLDGLEDGVDALFPGEVWPSRDLWIVGVNIEDGRRVVFGRDGAPRTSVGRAVASSCAIPGWFVPPVVDGARHIDGGAHSPTNADLLAHHTESLGLDLLVVSSPMSVAGGHYQPSAALNLRGTLRGLLRREIGPARARRTPVLTFQPTAPVLAAMGLNGMDPRRFDDVRDAAHDAAARRLADGRVHDLVAAALDGLPGTRR